MRTTTTTTTTTTDFPVAKCVFKENSDEDCNKTLSYLDDPEGVGFYCKMCCSVSIKIGSWHMQKPALSVIPHLLRGVF